MEGDTITPWRPSPSLGDGCIEVWRYVTSLRCNGVWEVVPKNERFKIIFKDNIKHGTLSLKSRVSLRLYWRIRNSRLNYICYFD